VVQCSRWTELTDALRFHVDFAKAASIPTEFRLLNSSLPIRIGFNNSVVDDDNNDDDVRRHQQLMMKLDDGPGD